MPNYPYGALIAYDPAVGALAPGAVGNVYAIPYTEGDTALSITDLSGIPLSELKASAEGALPPFIADRDTCVWVSGNYRVELESGAGIRNAAEASAASANEALQTVQALVPTVEANRVPGGGLSGQVLAKATSTDNDVTWIDPPSGGAGAGGVLVLGATEAIPPGTPAMSAIFRISGEMPTPDEVSMLTGTGNVTVAYDSLHTDITISAPSNTAPGDVLVAVGWAQASAAPFEWSIPPGWSKRFESAAGRRLLVATFPVTNQAAADAVKAAPGQFYIPGDTSNSRNGVMIFRLIGASLTSPVVGVSAFTAGAPTGKTFPAFSASSPASAQLLVATAQLSAEWTTHPVATYPAGLQAANDGTAYGTGATGNNSETVTSAALYRFSGTSVPERVALYTPGWSAGVEGLQLAIAGA